MENNNEITVKKDGKNWISSLLKNLMEFASNQFAWMKLDKLSVWNQPVNLRLPLRYRADAVTGTTSRRWRGAPELTSTQGATVIFKTEAGGDHGRQRDAAERHERSLDLGLAPDPGP